MTQYPDDDQHPSQRGGEGDQVPGSAYVQHEEEEAARVEAEAHQQLVTQIADEQADEEQQEQLLRQIAEEQAADLWQQMAEEDADFGLYPFIDPGLYW